MAKPPDNPWREAVDRYLRRRHDLSRLEPGIAESVYRAAREALQATIRKMLDLDAKSDPFDPEITRRKQRLQALMAELAPIYRGAADRIRAEWMRDLPEIAQLEADVLQESWGGIPGVGWKPVRITDDLIRVIAETPIGGTLLGDWPRRTFGSHLERVRRVITQAAFEGKGIDAAARAVREEFRDALMRRDAMTLASTYVQTIEAGVDERYYARNHVDRLVYVATLDSSTCPLCAPLDGTVWDLDNLDRPSIPRHPRCRCTYVPYVERFSDLEFARPYKSVKGGRPERRRTSGYMRGGYRAWFERQPEEWQRSWLGRARWELWKAGKLKLTKLLNADLKLIKVRELRERMGVAE